MDDSGWDASAEAWIADMGTDGDRTRRWIADPAVLARLDGRTFRRALDVGCGEGRFCRMLQARGIATIGLDPTVRLVGEARRRDPSGTYVEGRAEALPFAAASFDLVVSYCTLIDIEDLAGAVREMARVLEPGGMLLVVNLTSFSTAARPGWIKDANGVPLRCHPVDDYLDTRADWVAWRGIRIRNWHRPLSVTLQAFLAAGLRLVHFDEPAAVGPTPEAIVHSRRRPYVMVMDWTKDGAA